MRTCHDGCLGPVDFTGYCEKHGAPIQTDAESEELAELRKDRERLDWLWRNSGGTYNARDEAWCVIYTLYVGPDDWPDDPREAIDHMMRIEP